MEGWALAISIVAAIAAGVSVWYTRRQALSADVVARNDTERLRRDVAPEFEAEVEDMRSWFRMWVKLVKHGPVERVSVEIVEPKGVSFTHSQNGVDPNSMSDRKSAEYDGLDLGERNCRRIEWTDEKRPKEIQVRITSHAGNAAWSTTMAVAVPKDMMTEIAVPSGRLRSSNEPL